MLFCNDVETCKCSSLSIVFLLKHFYTFFFFPRKKIKKRTPEKSCSLIFCAVLQDKSKLYMWVTSSLENTKDESSRMLPHLGMLKGLRQGGMLCQGWSQELLSFMKWDKAFLPALKHFALRNNLHSADPMRQGSLMRPTKTAEHHGTKSHDFHS